MEYRIGKIQGDFGENGHKFVVFEENGDHVYYSHQIDRFGNPDHDEIIKFYYTNIHLFPFQFTAE